MATSKTYNANTFERGNKVLLADEVQAGMIIALSNNKYFYVDDIDKFFINDEIGKLYDEEAKDKDIKPEHTTITFYDEDDNEITDVPGTAKCICFKRVNGKHTSITKEDKRKSREAFKALVRANREYENRSKQ